MSENSKTNNETEPSCLHCRVHNSKQVFQEIFDEVGIEIELPDLLAKYFQLNVKPDPKKQQLLCQECVRTLIRFFDIDELQREQDAASAAKNKAKKQGKIEATPSPAPVDCTKEAKSTKKQTPPATKAKSETRKLTSSVELPAKSVAASAAKVSPVAESVSIRIIKGKSVTVTSKRSQIKTSPKPSGKSAGKRGSSKEGEQAQISELLRDILDDEKAPTDRKFAEAAETVRQLETQVASEEKQLKQASVELEEETDKQQENTDELEFLLEDEDVSSGSDHFKDTSQSQNESQSEDDSHKVEPFNFVLIKESDDIEDLYEYLGGVVKTCFETLTFEWATVCCLCSLKCNKYETLLAHMIKCHQLPEERYKCPIEDCDTELQSHKSLAMHLVLLHAPVADIPIYGCCPECNMTFSNILQYNKHSCAHVIKKRRGIRLYCEMCGLEFPSWKRFNFHNQFHLERHRPRACFVCDYADNNIDELFQHLHYSHEPEGTHFCDICDLNFRDAAVLAEHNKTHTNVSSTTYTCHVCDANFETRGRLNSHVRITHSSAISCELCCREFATETTYNIHMKKHLIIEREVHVCSNCGQLSENHEKMLSHVENEASVCYGVEIYVEILRDAYVCEYCSAYFKQKTDLRAHRDSGVHKDGYFWCHPCGKEFTEMKLYRHHMRNYQQQLADVEHRKLELCLYFMCDYEDCFEAYVNWNSLYTHKRRTHELVEKLETKPKVNEWICQFCQKVCQSKMSLSVHVARSHNNNNVTCSLCKASYKDQEALKKHNAYWHEPMECALCLKIIKNRRNFDTHMNVVHSNNKRYSCSVCQKGFYHKSEMESHKRLHSQSYSCEQCSFVTKNKKSLSVHILGQHYKRYAFECSACNKRFGRRQGLTNHIQRAHGSKHMCRDFFEGGCNKYFATTAQLNMHVRKVHNGSILLVDPEDDEQQERDDEQKQQQQQIQPKLEISEEPSTSKKRCIRFNDDTQIEFIGPDPEEDIQDHEQEIKFKPPPTKRKKKQS